MTQPYPDDWHTRAREVKKRDDWECRNCGRKGGPRGDVELHAHHIVPAKNFGTHHIDNLVTLCARCHEAAEDMADAPTILLDNQSMPDHEFEHYRQFMHEQAQAWYDEDRQAWRLPTKNAQMERYD